MMHKTFRLSLAGTSMLMTAMGASACGPVDSADEGRIGVVAALVRATFLVNAVYAESGREHGLTPQQGQLLCVLMSGPRGRPTGPGSITFPCPTTPTSARAWTRTPRWASSSGAPSGWAPSPT